MLLKLFPVSQKHILRTVKHKCRLWAYKFTANKDPWFHMFCKWIHEFNWLNLREFTGFCEQIWCVDTCLPWNHEFFTWCDVLVKPYQLWPSTTHVKLVQNSWQQAEHVYSREYTWKHIQVERYQLWTSMTPANWFRNGSLFARSFLIFAYSHTNFDPHPGVKSQGPYWKWKWRRHFSAV